MCASTLCDLYATVQRDKSQLTIAELREAKAKKEAMLRASIRDATTNGLNSITTEVC